MAEVDLSGNLDVKEPQPTPKKGIMSLTLSNLQWREYLQKTRESVQPWGQFVNPARFTVPRSLGPIRSRVVANIEKFQSNYLFVFVGLVVFCILTSPMLLLAIAACLGACYIISFKNKDRKVAVMGKELTLVQQYAAIGVLSFPLFWIAGAGSAVFWVIGASFLLIMLHATFYTLDDELNEITEIQMEEV